MSKLSPKLRMLMIVIAALIVVVLVIKVLLPSSTDDLQLPSSVSHKIVTPQRPMAVNTDDYSGLAKKYQQAQVEKAALTGESYVPNIFSDARTPVNVQDQPANTTPEDPEKFYAGNKNKASSSNIGNLQTITAVPVTQNDPQVLQNNAATNASMDKSIENLLKALNTQDASQTFTAVQTATDIQQAQSGVQQPVLIKAGDILFATINTAVNSDQAGTPVLATIITGKYREAKLLGSFQLADERLVVHFNLMTLPDQSQSLAIDAYAVDENTAQASLTGEVNHHYMLRYGSLFAAAFLQGFGSYFSDRNDDNVVCSKDSVICVNNQLNNSAKDAAFSGLGQVGTALSSSVQQQFSRPITVELARGTGLGVLFMRDVEPSDSAAGQNASLTADKSPTVVKS